MHIQRSEEEWNMIHARKLSNSYALKYKNQENWGYVGTDAQDLWDH